MPITLGLANQLCVTGRIYAKILKFDGFINNDKKITENTELSFLCNRFEC